MEQSSPGSRPAHGSREGLLQDSLAPAGHLAQAISEHLACATGGSGRPTTPADVSPQDYGPLGAPLPSSESAHETLNHPAAADSPAVDDHAPVAHQDSHPADQGVEATWQPADGALVELDSDEHASTSQTLLHQRPLMETPSSKRHKVTEAASEADTSSSELNPADFGLSSTPVWQRSPAGSLLKDV